MFKTKQQMNKQKRWRHDLQSSFIMGKTQGILSYKLVHHTNVVQMSQKY